MDEGGEQLEQDIVETVRTGLLTHNAFRGKPDELAALLLSSAGQYRSHPRTPAVLRRIGWRLAGQSPPDLRAKLSLAILRLAEDGTTSAGMPFIDDLHLWATRPGRDATVGVTHTETGRIVAQFDYTDGNLAINSELAAEGSDFPPQLIADAVSLVTVYVEDLAFADPQRTPEST